MSRWEHNPRGHGKLAAVAERTRRDMAQGKTMLFVGWDRDELARLDRIVFGSPKATPEQRANAVKRLFRKTPKPSPVCDGMEDASAGRGE